MKAQQATNLETTSGADPVTEVAHQEASVFSIYFC